jgi:hypothetical protein
MQRRFWKVVGVIVGMLAAAYMAANLIFWGFCTEDYGLVCTQCLERYTYIDRSFFGIRYSRVIRPEDPRVPFWFRPAGTAVQFDSDTYERIFGRPCVHHLIRYGGFGRESGGLQADGIISTPPGIEVRLFLLARLFETFDRLPDRALAQSTYAMIDHEFPESLDWHSVVAMPSLIAPELMPNEPGSILIRGMAHVRDRSDWQAVLDAAQKRNGNVPLLKSADGAVVR